MKRLPLYLFILLPSIILHSNAMASATTIWKSITSFFTPDEKKIKSETIPTTTSTPSITIKNYSGSITVNGWDKPEILLKTEIKGPQEKISSTHVSHKNAHATLMIETKTTSAETALPVIYTLSVPEKSSLIIEQETGALSITDIYGPLTVQTDNGSINIENAQESVAAKAPRGSISLDVARLLPHASLFLEAGKGISLSLPDRTNANIEAQSSNGFVTIDFNVTLKTKTVKINKKEWNLQRRFIEGTIGTGGPSIVLSTIDRSITVSKR